MAGLVTLLGLAKKSQERVAAIDERELEAHNDDSNDSDLLHGKLTAALRPIPVSMSSLVIRVI